MSTATTRETPRGSLVCRAPLTDKTCLERKVNSPCLNCRAWLRLEGAASNTGEATPRPWPEPTYENDTGPNDEGYWQWYEIAGVAKFNSQEDAFLAWRAVNSFDAQYAALQTCKSLLANSRMGGQNHAEQNAYEQVCAALAESNGGEQ